MIICLEGEIVVKQNICLLMIKKENILMTEGRLMEENGGGEGRWMGGGGGGWEGRF